MMISVRVCVTTAAAAARQLSAAATRQERAAWSGAEAVCARTCASREGNAQSVVMMKSRTMSSMSSSRTAIENRLLYRSKQRGFLELDIILVCVHDVCVCVCAFIYIYMKQERSAADEREEKMNLCVYSFVCVCVCVCVCVWLRMVQGNWAESHVRSLTSDELDEFDRLLACENPDLFKYLTGQETEPDELASNAVYAVRSGRMSMNTESVLCIAAHSIIAHSDDRRLMMSVIVCACMYMHRLCA